MATEIKFNHQGIQDDKGTKVYEVSILGAGVGDYCFYQNKIWKVVSYYQSTYGLERESNNEKTSVKNTKLPKILNSGYISIC